MWSEDVRELPETCTIATVVMVKDENVLATITMDKDENAIQDTSVEEVEEIRREGTEENIESQRETVESNRAVVAIYEDELEKNKGEHGSETIMLSTYDSEESVREDCEDLNESTTEVLIFADTLLKSLKRTTRKGKTKWKWTGKIAELMDFVALVLEHKRSWKIRRENNKQMHVFEESDCNYVLTWWPSTVMLF